MKKEKYYFIGILLLLLCQISFSHPHVFFDANSKLEIEGNHVEGLELSLQLDEMNTLLNRKILKAAKDGEVQEKNIIFLKYLYSHIHIFWNGKKIPKENILFELATLEEEQLRIDFFISIDKKINPKDCLKIAFYDTNYYYTYDYSASSFQIRGLPKEKWKARLFVEKGISFYFRSVHPSIYEVIFL